MGLDQLDSCACSLLRLLVPLRSSSLVGGIVIVGIFIVRLAVNS